MKKYISVILLSVLLFIVPFFWLKPGEMDLGGDNTRLYFYDPASFLKYLSMYNISQVGKGSVIPEYFYVPFVSILALLKYFLSSTALISIINGLKLSVGFASVYFIVNELIVLKKKNSDTPAVMASMLAGLFYIVSFGSLNMTFFWDRALITHDQIFVNPLMCYLLLKFMLTQRSKFLWISIVLSFIFSSNFSPVSAPPFFAFYPLVLIYVYIYARLFNARTRINIWTILCGMALFLGVQSFHLLGELINVFDSKSAYNTRIFNTHEILSGGLAYFTAISGRGKAVFSLLLPSENRVLQLTSCIAPVIIIIGFLLDKTLKKKFLLTVVFFLITLFFVTANITAIGFRFYKTLFYIPGFSMFRIFYEKWSFVYIFFYALLFGFGSYILLSKLKPHYRRFFFLSTMVLFIISMTPLLLGKPVNTIRIDGSNNIKSLIRMDPAYEATLKYIRTLPSDGKFLVLPLTDNFRQLIYGEKGGVYEGPSTISFLTNKYSFAGYQDFGYQSYDPAPYADDVMKYSSQKDYKRLLRIFNTLNIRYIFHNTDPRIFEEKYYPGGDYYYMRPFLPKTQFEYERFIKNFPVKEIYKNGTYMIYELDGSEYNPTVYIPQDIYISDRLSYDQEKSHFAFISSTLCKNKAVKEICSNYKPTSADINTLMINPTSYEVRIRNFIPETSLFLILQHTFNSDWNVKLNNKTIASQTHISVNGYANGWLIPGKDLPATGNFTLDIVLDSQKYFRYGSALTVISLVILIFLITKSFFSPYEKN